MPNVSTISKYLKFSIIDILLKTVQNFNEFFLNQWSNQSHIYHHLRKHFQLSTYTKKHQHCDTPENNSTTIPHINHIFIPSFPSSRSHLFSRPILSFYTLFYLPQFSCKTFTKSNQYIHSSSIYPLLFLLPIYSSAHSRNTITLPQLPIISFTTALSSPIICLRRSAVLRATLTPVRIILAKTAKTMMLRAWHFYIQNVNIPKHLHFAITHVLHHQQTSILGMAHIPLSF